MPLQIKVLGGGREVGRSAILVRDEESTLLLDYGVMVTERKPEFPQHVSPKEITAVFVTHAHLDHSGAVPVFFTSSKPPVYMSRITAEFTDILIRDLINLSHYYLPYETLELSTMLENVRVAKHNTTKKVRSFEVTFLNAGHIPGSLSLLVKGQGKCVWYSGDINTIDTMLLKGAEIELPELDLAIIEGTYALVDHPDRKQCERKLVEVLTEVVENKGLALVPAFSVGRAQEVLCILYKYGFDYPVYLDGMARAAAKIMLKYPNEFREFKLLKKALKKAHWVKGAKERKRIREEACVVVTPAGMLSGGAALYYMDKVVKSEYDAVVLVSYQVKGTPGRRLLDEGVYEVDGKLKKVKCRVEWIDLSSHCGKKELQEIIRKLPGNPKVLVVHGEEGACLSLAAWVKEEVGFEAIAPANGEMVTLR